MGRTTIATLYNRTIGIQQRLWRPNLRINKFKKPVARVHHEKRA